MTIPARDPERPAEHAGVLYLSHGASGWFIVEPRDNPWPQVESLLRAHRRVICVTDTGNGPTAKEM